MLRAEEHGDLSSVSSFSAHRGAPGTPVISTEVTVLIRVESMITERHASCFLPDAHNAGHMISAILCLLLIIFIVTGIQTAPLIDSSNTKRHDHPGSPAVLQLLCL